MTHGLSLADILKVSAENGASGKAAAKDSRRSLSERVIRPVLLPGEDRVRRIARIFPGSYGSSMAQYFHNLHKEYINYYCEYHSYSIDGLLLLMSLYSVKESIESRPGR